MVLISYPNNLNIFLNKRCNLRCNYCFVNKNGSKNKEINIASLNKAIDIFLELPGRQKTISFSGGEPLLRFGKIRNLYQYMQHKNNGNAKLVVAVVTNGTFLSESHYNFFKENGIILKVSIDGNKSVHDYNRPFKLKKYGSSYERIIKNLKQFRGNKNEEYKIGASLVFSPVSVRRLLKNIKSLWKIGFGYIDFYPDLYAHWSEEELDEIELVLQEFKNFYLAIFENAKSENDIFENSLLHNFINEIQVYKPILCQKIHLDWKGNFYCCDKVFSLPEYKRKEFIIGDIDRGIDNRLRLRLLDQKRKEIRDLTGKDCNVCKYLKYCFCPIGHYIYFTSCTLDFKQYFPQFCRISQIYIKNFLEIKRYLKSNPLFTQIYS